MNTFHRWFCRSAYWKKTLEEKIVPWALKGIEMGDNVLEIGPGPGMTTDVLRQRFARLTSVEIDHALAESLKQRMQGTNVQVVEKDATAMPFENNSFSGAVSFTMLHHVPSAEMQNRLLAEVFRVLQPGAMFVGTDSTWSRSFQLIHLFDTMVVVDPETFGKRLETAGFTDVSVKVVKSMFGFRARHP
jgi:ubiquinone/menaquinone biosynthesis C-methylase UbiE